jgi:RNA polymerase sigma factor (sigma-70 family)
MSQSGLRAIFLEQRPMLLRMLTARLRSADEAEEVLQELWLKLERDPTGPIGQPAAYLFRMAHNQALDHRRGAHRRAAREASWLAVQPGAVEHPDAERALIARDRIQRIEQALAAMPERSAAAFRLYRFEELPRPSIAERLGISISAVEKLLHRAYRHLQDFAPDGAVDPASSRRHDDKGVTRS